MKLQRATTLSLLTLLTLTTVTTISQSIACPGNGLHIEPHLSLAPSKPCKMHQTCTFGCNETHDTPAKIMPHAARFYAQSGDTKVLAHDFAGAIDDYTRATELNPSFDRVYSLATDYFMDKHDLHELLIDYNQAIAKDPTNPYALALRGEMRYGIGDTEGAEADFRKSLQYKGDLYFAHLRLTELAIFSEYSNISTADFERALGLFPQSARMHHNMGLALGRLGFTKMAVAEYNEASRLSPEWSRPYYMMAFAELERGDRNAAMIDLDKCIKYEPTWSWAYVMRAMQESKIHNYTAAIKDLDQAIAIEPDSKWLEACRARLKLSSGDTLGGLSDFIGIASKRSEFHILLAMWFILAQMKLVTLGRESIRRRLIVNE